jgi:uncharacterized protein (DUF111 family)
MRISSLVGEAMNAVPEFEDCVARAKAAGVPVKTVLAAALASYETTREKGGAR